MTALCQPISYYEVRIRPAAVPDQWTYHRFNPAQPILLHGVEIGTMYVVEVRCIPVAGMPSVWASISHMVQASTLYLPQIVGVVATPLADGVHLIWTRPPGLAADVRIEIYRAPDAGGIPGMFTLLYTAPGTAYNDAVVDGAPYWYTMRFIDYAGSGGTYSTPVFARAKTVANGATVGGTLGVDVIAAPGGPVLTNLDQMPEGPIYQRDTFRKSADLIANGDFEAGDTLPPPLWSAGPTGLMAGEAGPNAPAGLAYLNGLSAYNGQRSLQVACSGDYQGVAARQSLRVVPGESFVLSAVGIASTGEMRVIVRWYDRLQQWLFTDAILTFGFEAWAEQTATIVAPANAYNAILLADNSNSGGSTFYLDNVVLRRVSLLDIDVQDGATYGRTRLDILTGGRPDMSKPIVNNTADYVLQTETRRWAAETGAQVVTGKPLDILSDGTVYGRPRLDILTDGRPDMSKPIVNNTADYVLQTETRRWAGETGATVGARAGLNLLSNAGAMLGDSEIVTSQGTANDVTNVNGVSAATVRTNAQTGAFLTLATSGVRIGGGRNLPPVRTANAGALWNGLTLGASWDTATPANVTLSASAATLQQGSYAASFGASSVTVSGITRGVPQTYRLFYEGSSVLSGGTFSLQATTSQITVVSSDTRIHVGNITFTVPASGGGSGGTGSGGGGGQIP